MNILDTPIGSVGLEALKTSALLWASSFDVCCVLDSNRSEVAYDLLDIEFLMAAGVKKEFIGTGKNDWDKLKQFVDGKTSEDIIPGFFTYDLKNQVERLTSAHPDHIGFPPAYFFIPKHLFIINKNGDVIVKGDISRNKLLEILYDMPDAENIKKRKAHVTLKQKVQKTFYMQNVEAIRQHIIEGDVYELNYCVEFFDEHAKIDPIGSYLSLREESPMPFGAYFRHYDKHLLCASPERFLKKTGNKLFSQPIKGTQRRGDTELEDYALMAELANSEKERAENLMIVDLVRNDLAKSSVTGTVKVEEIFGIYTFNEVHQMISTVSSEINPTVHPVDIVKNAFPMGSMTGAPKVRAMELIEKFEQTKRGLYSGALGYFGASNDFDLNVVIRSIQYNAKSGYLNFEVGSAITYDSNPEDEYNECLLKANAMVKVLSSVTTSPPPVK